MTPADLDALTHGAADPAVATLARALREAWAERSKTDARADRLAYAVNLRDAILARAGAKFGWPSGLSVTSGWRDMMERAVDETAAKLSRLENTIAQSRESYPRAEVLRMLNAAGVEGVGIVDRVRRLMSERDALRAIVEKRTHFSGSKYSPAGTLIESVACPRCNVPNAPQPRDGGAVCTRCNGSRVVDGDACVCAGGGR